MTRSLKTRAFQRLPAFWQRPVRVFRIATAQGAMPRAARLRLMTVIPRLVLPGTRGRDMAVRLPGGTVHLGAESVFVDAMTLGYVWREGVFSAECAGRVVLDLGAHKGYFAAWALAHGAAHVYSFEPERSNFDRLERAQRNHEDSRRWTVRRAAVGEKDGKVSLFVSAESWAHSVHEGMVDALGVEQVDMVAMSAVLQEVESNHPGVDIVIKMNVEGSVGSIVLPLAPAELSRVMEVHLDHEPGSPYDIDAVLSHLASAGLRHVDRPRDKIFVIRRGPLSAA